MRMTLSKLSALSVVLACVHAATTDQQALVSVPGDTAIIPGWSLQSETKLPHDDIVGLSRSGADVSSWYRMRSRGTVMAGLIENGVFDKSTLFYSENLDALKEHGLFTGPFIYREEFLVKPGDGHYFTLKTHGIASKADLYVNGVRIAFSGKQAGSYGGHAYNLTDIIESDTNCILIRAYPTNYLRDFAQGFVDWNPYPADNGTGVWRNVELSLTGAVSMSPLRILTDFHSFGNEIVNVTLKTEVVNHGPSTVAATVNGTINGPDGREAALFEQAVELKAGENKALSIRVPVKNPQIWWPARWGAQPLYTVHASAMIQGDGPILSDKTSPQRFGIRHVWSSVNEHNDTAFSINGQSFQVIGAGYGPDMFLRFDEMRVEKIFRYMLDMGLNTVRLEGKQEHPELYDLADRMGLMVLAGWECCDKWEAWEYNHDADGVKWGEDDYSTARASMLHEAEMMQPHPSMLGFLIGSDYWPNDRATKIYLDALREMDWRIPIIASASMRGFPEALGPSGMKMNGPYDWVPPNYWYGDEQGAAFGFGSELGAGVGTPELGSLKKFMSPDEMETLWTEPEAGLYHMSNSGSPFHDRSIYNKGLYARYGKPSSLEDYVLKCQMADYEATRAQFEAYSARQNASRLATGLIYWMLNSAWPNLHWQLFDYYLNPMGAYFGTKVGTRMEHIAYDYQSQSVWLISHSRGTEGERQIKIDLIDADGNKISSTQVKRDTTPNASKQVQTVSDIDKIQDVAFLRLVLRDMRGERDLSRNVYWLSSKPDVLDWLESNWYYTPVTAYADFTKLQHLESATVKASVKKLKSQIKPGWSAAEVQLENKSKVPAVFIRLNAIKKDGAEIAPVYWSDNYVTLWPKEKLELLLAFEGDLKDSVIEVSGRNVQKQALKGPK